MDFSKHSNRNLGEGQVLASAGNGGRRQKVAKRRASSLTTAKHFHSMSAYCQDSADFGLSFRSMTTFRLSIFPGTSSIFLIEELDDRFRQEKPKVMAAIYRRKYLTHSRQHGGHTSAGQAKIPTPCKRPGPQGSSDTAFADTRD